MYIGQDQKEVFFLFLRNREWKVQSKLVKGFPGTKVQLLMNGVGETAATAIQHGYGNTELSTTQLQEQKTVATKQQLQHSSSSSNSTIVTPKQQQQHGSSNNSAAAATQQQQ
jgi:hypothetical protein